MPPGGEGGGSMGHCYQRGDTRPKPPRASGDNARVPLSTEDYRGGGGAGLVALRHNGRNIRIIGFTGQDRHRP